MVQEIFKSANIDEKSKDKEQFDKVKLKEKVENLRLKSMKMVVERQRMANLERDYQN